MSLLLIACSNVDDVIREPESSTLAVVDASTVEMDTSYDESALCSNDDTSSNENHNTIDDHRDDYWDDDYDCSFECERIKELTFLDGQLQDGEYYVMICLKAEITEQEDGFFVTAGIFEYYIFDDDFVNGLVSGSIIKVDYDITVEEILYSDDNIWINNRYEMIRNEDGWRLFEYEFPITFLKHKHDILVTVSTEILDFYSPWESVEIGSLPELMEKFNRADHLDFFATIRDGHIVERIVVPFAPG